VTGSTAANHPEALVRDDGVRREIIGVHIRRIDPVSVDRTVVSVRPLLVDGAPEQVNWLRLRYHELFYGPAMSATRRRSAASTGSGRRL
jgi:hypothetical protein